ncbi:MAG: glycosyltransferase family 39 protein [Candidatus Promineofilum sp.]|uniref:glycosyltransferase family 39 protein n=1 Tax=Promineifilum sp. TaxID=2664178 RepID=UPI002411F6D1|nr:glycosyltransferase family 39 protein [Promineifilum sp.]
MTRRREGLLVMTLFIVAMLASGMFWAVLPAEYRENQSTDYALAYEPVARNIVAGRGVTLEGDIATRYPPGFAVLLAGIFRLGDALHVADETMVLAFRLLCVGLAVVLIYGLARLLWSPRAALIPAVAWMTYPFALWLTKQPNSEVPFIPVFFAAMLVFWWALLRERGGGARAGAFYLAAGALSGAAMLIRPAALGLSIVMALLVLLFAARATALRTRLLYGALVVLGSILVVLPWEAAVYARTSAIIPLSSGGPATIYDGLTFLAVPKDYRREVAIPEDVADLMWAIHERRAEATTTGGVFTVLADEARVAPAAFIKLMLIKLARSWYGIDSRVMERPTLLIQIVYLLLATWGTLYCVRQGGAARRLIGGNWLIVFYFWAMTFTVIPLLRYMTPVMGLLMLPLPGVYYSLIAWRQKRVIGTVSPDY